jgi:hypothetical protein
MFPVESVAIAGMPKPASTATGVKDFVGFTVGAAGAARLMAAVPNAEASATDAAVIVTVPAVARAADVYVTTAPAALVVGEIEPQPAPMQFVPDRDHATPRFCASFVTFAVKVCVTPPVAMFAVPGVTDTVGGDGGGGVNAIVAFADFVASSTDVAVSVTIGGFGTAAGAVYITAVPDAAVVPDKVPQAAPVHPAPESVHDVPLFFGSFDTVAMKLVTWLACTVAVLGESVTATLAGCGAGLVEDPPPHPQNIAAAIITHALIAATPVRSTPRGKTIYPPEKRSGTGAAF